MRATENVLQLTQTNKPMKLEVILTGIIAALISAAFVLGRNMSISQTIELNSSDVCAFLLIAIVAYVVLFALWRLADWHQHRPAPHRKSIVHKWRASAISGLIIFAFWIPTLLAGYPGFFTYDAGTDYLMQWGQIESGVYNAHHPIVHTFFLEITIKLGIVLFGSFNAGVCLSVVIQATVIAMMFCLVIRGLLHFGLGRIGLALTVIYLALDPIISMFAFCTTKDSLFAAFVMLYCTTTTLLIASNNDSSSGSKSIVLLMALASVCGFLIAILRTNGLVALVVIVPLVAVTASGRLRRIYLATSLVSLFLALLFLGPISTALNVQSSPIGKWNSLCVVEQQIARCTVDGDISEEDKQLVSEKLPSLKYQADLSDIARNAFMDPTSAGMSELLKLYFYLGCKYPKTYLEAFLFQTEDAWSPYGMIDCYTPGSETTSNVFATNQQAPATRESKCPGLLDLITYIANNKEFYSVPIVSLIVSIPFYILTLMICLTRTVLTRNKTSLCFLIPLVILTLSNIFGPCMLIRYFLYLLFALPAMIYFSFFWKSEQPPIPSKPKHHKAIV